MINRQRGKGRRDRQTHRTRDREINGLLKLKCTFHLYDHACYDNHYSSMIVLIIIKIIIAIATIIIVVFVFITGIVITVIVIFVLVVTVIANISTTTTTTMGPTYLPKGVDQRHRKR